VPPTHVKVLTAPLGRTIDYSVPDAPTKKNVLKALKKMGEKETGAFIYFHYSGHGSRSITRYPNLKGAGQKDETICTWEEDITDVELGNLLDQLSHKHTVLAVLDSCHSGGADREEFQPLYKIRCRDYSTFVSANRGTEQGRNATPTHKSELYRERGYDLIAACHPNERANEWCYSKTENGGKKKYPCGAMTYFFLKSLESFARSKSPITYGQLQSVLNAEMEARSAELGQTPMHLGNRDRIIFANTALSTELRGLANVVDKSQDSVTLNRGSSRQVQVGDRFLLYPPSQVYLGLITADDSAGREVEITRTRVLESTAIIIPDSSGSLDSIQTGWFARLSSRLIRKTVHVQLPPDDDSPALHRLRRLEVNPDAPFKLVFTPPAEDADFTVRIGEDRTFLIEDKEKDAMTTLPLISAYGERNLPQLMGLLNRLSFYQFLLETTTGSGGQRPSYEFSLEKAAPDEENPESLDGWKISFKNKSPATLYLTILTLGPAYGIQELFPNGFASSTEVAPMEEIPGHVFVDIVVPELLASARGSAGFQMSDRFKVFVTRKPVQFTEYTQHDIVLDPAELELNARRATIRRPRVSEWVVDEAEIITQRLDDGSFITFDASNPPGGI
ncbi:hypothetical protein CEP53_009407, partial [Fusarium sp. AF-6]